jgi:hypothetical protein
MKVSQLGEPTLMLTKGLLETEQHDFLRVQVVGKIEHLTQQVHFDNLKVRIQLKDAYPQLLQPLTGKYLESMQYLFVWLRHYWMQIKS